MNDTFENRIAIVTGGASGIGEALGRELAARTSMRSKLPPRKAVAP